MLEREEKVINHIRFFWDNRGRKDEITRMTDAQMGRLIPNVFRVVQRL